MPASSTIKAIDSLFADYTPDGPGVAVGVVRDGEPVYSRAFGLASVEHRVPNTVSTLFDIGSVTKQFTAFAVLLLERDGRLTLDDDIRVFVPELTGDRLSIRIRHCLYHTSGLNDWVSLLEFTGPIDDYCAFDRAFETIIHDRQTMFPPGKSHGYSNTGYLLLALIVERITGRPLPEFLRERVFMPLGMLHSTFLQFPGDVLANHALGYYKNEDGRLDRTLWPCAVHGDGGMRSSVHDMLLWLKNFTTQAVGDAALFDQLFAPGQLDNGQFLRYAAGWEIERYRGLRAVRHGGMSAGFQSHIAWFPAANIGVVILGNVRPCLPWPMANLVLDVLLENSQSKLLSRARIVGSDADTHTPSDDIAGRYFTASGLPTLVDWHGGRLRIDIWLWRRLFNEESVDVHTERDSGDRVRFHRNAEGKVTHFTLTTEDGACPRMHSSIRTATKFENIDLDEAALVKFEGRYISDELDTIYTIAFTDNALTAKHKRCYDWQLRPIRACDAETFQDEFAPERDWPGKVTFERTRTGEVAGFRVCGARAHVFFRKFSARD